MSKRSALPKYGDPKKPKLDISRSHHHLPLSQTNSAKNKENNSDVWGDDDDEQMLLQASQACEEEQSTSILPDYNSWQQPGSTSTQYMPSPSTSKAAFEFKKPSSVLPRSISTNLKSICNTISSPLPGISTMSRDRHSSSIDDLGITEKIVLGEESDIRKRMLQLEEKNNKIKSEHSKLSDKYVAKEGEVSILRSQLRSLQVANDNARMETIRARERVEMEWNEKYEAIKKEKQSLKDQLEFKDLEILNVKDKLKKSDANKLRLTQVNDISSHRNNNTLPAPYDAMTQQKRVKMTSNSVQTEDKAPFLKLNKSCRKDVSMAAPRNASGCNVPFNVTRNIMPDRPEIKDDAQLFSEVTQELCKLESELKALDASSSYPSGDERLTVTFTQLCDPPPLYPSERGAGARRSVAALARALQPAPARAQAFLHDQARAARAHTPTVLGTAQRICDLIERNSCGVPYSGFLMSLIITFGSLHCAAEVLEPKIVSLVKSVLRSKPMPFVILELLMYVRQLSSMNNFLSAFCPGNTGDDAMDVDQDRNNPEPCFFVELLKQTEDCLARIKHQGLETGGPVANVVLRNLVDIFDYVNDKYRGDYNRCSCQQRAARALARALREAGAALARAGDRAAKWYKELLAACRSCVRQVNKCVELDAEWVARLQRHEGLLSDAVHRLLKLDPSLAELTELRNAFQIAPEETPTSYLKQPLMASFESFSMTD